MGAGGGRSAGGGAHHITWQSIALHGALVASGGQRGVVVHGSGGGGVGGGGVGSSGDGRHGTAHHITSHGMPGGNGRAEPAAQAPAGSEAGMRARRGGHVDTDERRRDAARHGKDRPGGEGAPCTHPVGGGAAHRLVGGAAMAAAQAPVELPSLAAAGGMSWWYMLHARPRGHVTLLDM